MRAPWRDVALGASSTMCLGMMLIVITRCYSDAHLCANEPEHTTLSWLLDDDWRVTFAAVLIGCCALVHLALLWTVWTPRELRSRIVRGIRGCWTLGYSSAVAVAVFTVTEHPEIHYTVAFTMFASMIAGAALALWWGRGRHVYFGWQALHLVSIVGFVLLYTYTWNGWYEIVAIFLIVLYFNWLSLGDHWTEDVELGVKPEHHVRAMVGQFVARGV